MKHAYIFPGQGAQFSGMGKNLYEQNSLAREYFEQANEILGFRITDIMFSGSDEELKQTKVTQPAIFLHSVILFETTPGLTPDAVAGHSLGEFSALVANKVLSFEDGLRLVSKRAQAMQRACEINPSTMAAVLGLDDEKVEAICKEFTDEVVVAASERAAIMTTFNDPSCPIYQNVDARPYWHPARIQENLIAQLVSPVRWTQIVQNMVADGVTKFTEVGPGNVLQGLVKKIAREAETAGISGQ